MPSSTAWVDVDRRLTVLASASRALHDIIVNQGSLQRHDAKEQQQQGRVGVFEEYMLYCWGFRYETV
jgi:hypothetical protein